MSYMTDTFWTAAVMNMLFNGGSAPSAPTAPLHLRLMTALGAGNGNVSGSDGTEATSSNCPGYTAGGSSLGSTAFGSFSASSPAAVTNNNQVSWSATGSWATIVGIEIWNTNGSPSRQAQGAVTSAISGVGSGDTVEFPAASISLDATAW
jgi:hypothetical protein